MRLIANLFSSIGQDYLRIQLSQKRNPRCCGFRSGIVGLMLWEICLWEAMQT